MVRITYNEAMTMLYLSQLIYDYNHNDKFDLHYGETISEFIKRIDIENNNFDYIRNSLFYLLHISPDGMMLKHIIDKNTNVHVAIIISNKCKNIAIVFKGTTSIGDYYYNFNIFSKQIKNFNIHSGFYGQIKSIMKQIFNIINPYLLNNYNLYLTGHSSGGANATLLTHFISEKYSNVLIKLITFGCPRVGDAQWKKSFEEKNNIIHYRITNQNDIVTIIPTINYFHVGREIYISNDKLCYMENYSCNSIINKMSFYYYNIIDHQMLNYVKNMSNKEYLWNQLYSNYHIHHDNYNEISNDFNDVIMMY